MSNVYIQSYVQAMVLGGGIGGGVDWKIRAV